MTIEVPELFTGSEPSQESEVLVEVMGSGRGGFSAAAAAARFAAEPQTIRRLELVLTGGNGQQGGQLKKKIKGRTLKN